MSKSKKEEVDEELDEELLDDEQVEDEQSEDEQSEDKSKKKKPVEITFETIEAAKSEKIKAYKEFKEKQKYYETVEKIVTKMTDKEIKLKSKRRNNSSDTPKAPSGFVKPRPVPEAFKKFYETKIKKNETIMKDFPDIDITNDLPRTTITKLINAYMSFNNLYEKNNDATKKDKIYNKKVYKPDSTIKELLQIKDKEEVIFNNFQTYISRLYNVVDAEDVEDEDAEDVEDEEEEEVAPQKIKSKNQVSSSRK